MTKAKRLVLAMAAALPLVAAGCGEETQVTVYKQGEYKGKPDSQPWANQQFSDKQTWEKAIIARTHGQDDYHRIGGN